MINEVAVEKVGGFHPRPHQGHRFPQEKEHVAENNPERVAENNPERWVEMMTGKE